MRHDCLLVTALAGAVAISSAAHGAAINEVGGMNQHTRETTGTAGSGPGARAKMTGAHLVLTNSQKLSLFHAAGGLPKQTLPKSTPAAPGVRLPGSIKLSPIPAAVRKKLDRPRISSYELARTGDGDVLIVDPADHVIRSVISKEEAAQAAGS